MQYKDSTVRQAKLTLDNNNWQSCLFTMSNDMTNETIYGIDSPFFNGYRIPNRTAKALIKQGYKVKEYHWTL
jgi:hypothetical protein